MKYVFSLCIVLLLLSCGGRQKELIGRWKLERIDYTEHFKDVPEEVRELLSRKMDEEFERLKDKTYFTFREDKALILESPNFLGKTVAVSGKYHLNAAQDSLYFDTEEPEKYRILTLENGELAIRTDELPKRTLYLSRSE